ncbi:MAG: hypothetical protein Fur009_7780 [Candidatus Microgenomates bacterium]
MAFVYILKSLKNNRFYIGSTQDINKRWLKHKRGEVKSTKNLRPLKIEFYQEYPNIKQARYIELKLKKLKRKDYLEKIIREKEIKIKPLGH